MLGVHNVVRIAGPLADSDASLAPLRRLVAVAGQPGDLGGAAEHLPGDARLV